MASGAVAKSGTGKGLTDILLQGLDGETQSSVSSRREERQQLREEQQSLLRGGDNEAGETDRSSDAREASAFAPSGLADPGPAFASFPHGTTGNDNLVLTAGNDIIDVLSGDDSVQGLDGNDTVFGGPNVDRVWGGSGNDTFYGDSGADYFHGGAGDDRAFGGGLVAVPQGNDFNESADADDQLLTEVVALTNGGYAVAWISDLAGDSTRVHLKFLDAQGNQVGPIRTVATPLAATELTIAQREGSDEVLVAYAARDQVDPPNNLSTFIARFDFAGNALTGVTEFPVTDAFDAAHPLIIPRADGSFFLAWHENGRDGDDWGIYVAHYRVGAGGIIERWPGTGDVLVNQGTNGQQIDPMGATLADGSGMVIAFTSQANDINGNVFFRLLTPSGNSAVTIGNDIQANATGTNVQLLNDIAIQPLGGWAMLWVGRDANAAFSLVMRIFDSAGTATSAEIIVPGSASNVPITDTMAQMTVLQDGGYFVVWQANSGDGNGSAILGQRFDILGNTIGGTVVVDQVTNGNQVRPTVTTGTDGTVLVSWIGVVPGGGTDTDTEVVTRAFRFGGSGGNETLDGSDGNDYLEGQSGFDTLIGGPGNDTVDGGEGSDTMVAGAPGDLDTFIGGDAGANNDLVDFSAFGQPVSINLDSLAGAAIALSGADLADSLVGIEHAIGTPFADLIVGNTAANTILGLAGADTLIGLDGGDSLFAGGGSDWTRYDQSPVGVVVNLGMVGAQLGVAGSHALGDVLNSIENAAGSGLADTLTGSAGNNTLLGLTGADSLFGGDGVDQLFGGDGNDPTLAGGTGADSIFGGTGSDSLFGNLGNDSLFGGIGHDRLFGNAEDDFLHGEAGGDSLFGGIGNDRLQYDPTDEAVIGGLDLDSLLGNSVADIVQLDAGRFTFGAERASLEFFFLGDGNDVFLNSSDATDFEALNSTGISVFGGTGRDVISMRGLGATTGIDDFVDGGAGNDQIWGGFGNDLLIGGDGADQIYGGKGNDSFVGGSGFDVFYVGHDEGTDTISDEVGQVNGLVLFWGWDSTFGGDFDGLDPSEVAIEYTGNDIIITLQNGGSVTFAREFNGSTWDSSVDVLNLWDYGDGDAGNSPTPPPQFDRDVWSATFDAATGMFTAFTLAVDG